MKLIVAQLEALGCIMFMIAKEARKAGFKVYTCSAVHGNERKIEEQNHIYIGNKLDKNFTS